MEWATDAENLQHALDTGLRKYKRGKENPKSTPVSQYSLDGKFIRSFDSIACAYRATGIRHISEVVNGKRKQSNGYIWKSLK